MPKRVFETLANFRDELRHGMANRKADKAAATALEIANMNQQLPNIPHTYGDMTITRRFVSGAPVAAQVKVTHKGQVVLNHGPNERQFDQDFNGWLPALKDLHAEQAHNYRLSKAPVARPH